MARGAIRNTSTLRTSCRRLGTSRRYCTLAAEGHGTQAPVDGGAVARVDAADCRIEWVRRGHAALSDYKHVSTLGVLAGVFGIGTNVASTARGGQQIGCSYTFSPCVSTCAWPNARFTANPFHTTTDKHGSPCGLPPVCRTSYCADDRALRHDAPCDRQIDSAAQYGSRCLRCPFESASKPELYNSDTSCEDSARGSADNRKQVMAECFLSRSRLRHS